MPNEHSQALAILCANVTERHRKGIDLLSEAWAAPDMGTMKAKIAEAKPMLADLSLSLEAITQTASVLATGGMPVGSTETTAEADPPAGAAGGPSEPYTSAEAASVAPASSSNAPASNEATGDVVPSDGDASAEDTAALKRKR